MAISAAMVKELRERTGGGMMECKKALVEANGDMTVAEDIIAKSGHRKAAKSASRTAAEGRIEIVTRQDSAAVVEINCETDFVARDESFIEFAQQIVEKVLIEKITEPTDLSTCLLKENMSVEQTRQAMIARIGENIQIRRAQRVEISANQHIGAYVHHARIGVLVVIEGGSEQLAKELAMHVAAMRPQYLTMQEVPQAIVEKEKEILLALAQQSGKPLDIIQKIVSGQLQKRLNEICLTGQAFFKDPDQSIAMVLKTAQAQVVQMVRFEVGEGIEVVKKSFEEEVMAARGDK